MIEIGVELTHILKAIAEVELQYYCYGVARLSRVHQIIGLFCRISSLL